jgi:hypothetical protein
VGDHPVYLDIKKTSPTANVETTAGQRPALELIYEASRKRGLKFMPVAWTSSKEDHLALIANAIDEDGHGAAIRHRPSEGLLLPGVRAPQLVEQVLGGLGVGPEDVDLMLDLEYLEPDSEPSADWLYGLFSELKKIGSWRSLILVATSVPSSFGNGLVPEDSIRALPRTEWPLWRALTARLDNMVAFGDYGVQNPVPPPDPPPVGPWATIRYTSDETLVVSRGFDIRKTDPQQYVTLSQRVVAHSAFRGESFSYGDAEIKRWSASKPQAAPSQMADFEPIDEPEEPAGLPYWRGVGTSHHLELITQQVRTLP